jgi:hypothetical protein
MPSIDHRFDGISFLHFSLSPYINTPARISTTIIMTIDTAQKKSQERRTAKEKEQEKSPTYD